MVYNGSKPYEHMDDLGGVKTLGIPVVNVVIFSHLPAP